VCDSVKFVPPRQEAGGLEGMDLLDCVTSSLGAPDELRQLGDRLRHEQVPTGAHQYDGISSCHVAYKRPRARLRPLLAQEQVPQGLTAFGEVPVDPGVGLSGGLADLLVGVAIDPQAKDQALLRLELGNKTEDALGLEPVMEVLDVKLHGKAFDRLLALPARGEREELVLRHRVEPREDAFPVEFVSQQLHPGEAAGVLDQLGIEAAVARAESPNQTAVMLAK
jgi:hypothetical protein